MQSERTVLKKPECRTGFTPVPIFPASASTPTPLSGRGRPGRRPVSSLKHREIQNCQIWDPLKVALIQGNDWQTVDNSRCPDEDVPKLDQLVLVAQHPVDLRRGFGDLRIESQDQKPVQQNVGPEATLFFSPGSPGSELPGSALPVC